MDVTLPDEQATTAAGSALARALPDLQAHALLLALSGELGSGKTTLARGLLRALGVTGTIRSPTYTLVEPYETGSGAVHHLDLYRLKEDSADLETLGYRELRGLPGLVMVEWPERAARALGSADMHASLAAEGTGRRLVLTAGTAMGNIWLDAYRVAL